MSNKQLKILGMSSALLAMLAVAMGAFAAHGLKAILDIGAIETIKTAVFYQFIHSLAILAILALMTNKPFIQAQHLFKLSTYMMLAGCVLFSGSLYCLALTEISWFGPITPIGGVAFIIGWLLVLIGMGRLSGAQSAESSNGK